MALLHTPAKEENVSAPAFSLKNIDGKTFTLEDCMGENGLLVMFICNHCPYVKAITDRLAGTCKTLQSEGIGVVAIMSNDTLNYPEDSFENMKKFAAQNSFTFPYLIDETQSVAKAYGAVCTPDFFGFDSNGILQYRGRLDSAANRPAGPDTIPELLNAMRTIKDHGITTAAQNPSMGCSIKWKE
ncbi:MAG: thioredoxin family protein [Alphaproteobacteria bacterium]|nr:thioredoxin family protein [Alphaproteobacteria bacterium]